ncbi:hypothetical protein [Collinsella sp. TM09-10AT]|uniref:hypothetical protein n=1 Tax=Collinsella sp. TM09-10AT TaxID=2292343 RepID=UPI000E435849|nr:hypothetical protein [Collinsella sp. TM09-10AT]RGJ10940.1 hypothetical protein DXD77_04545 [Collinsella sp. TM09-10AT]
MELSTIAPYIVSIIASIVSGISSYLVARNKSASDIQTLKESNEHEIEKLMKQHEVDLDNLKETHKLEMEKLEAEHRYSLELANSNAQNEMTKQLMGSLVGNLMAAPQMQDLFANALADSIKKGQQE